MAEKVKILIKNATILTVDPSLGNLASHDLLIVRDTISEIAPHIPAPEDAEIIEGTNCVLTPGFVDCHHHMWQQAFRSTATDWSLFDYVVEMRSIYASLLSADDVYLFNYIAALNLLHNGVTTVLDHCHIINSSKHADAAVKALKDSGIRGTFCYGFYENPPPPPNLHIEDEMLKDFNFEERKSDATRIRAEHFTNSEPERNMITFGIALSEPEAQPIEKTLEELNYARELGAHLITVHVAMGHYDIGQHLVQQLHDKQMLGPDLVFSHGASFTDNELNAIQHSGAGIVSTPETEAQMGMGHPVVFRASDAGCKISLGIDITSNQASDMVTQMRLALQIQREKDNCVSMPISIQRKSAEILRIGTLGGAEVMRLEKITGSLVSGKKADLVMFRCDDINTVPVINPVGTILFNTSPQNIDTVIVNGRILKRDGRLTGVDLPTLLQEFRTRSSRILHMADSIDKEQFASEWRRIIDGI